MAGLQLEGIVKRFGDTTILKGIDLHIADGEFVSLVGPSGCGKSTLLRIISGLERQSSGTIRLGDRCVDDLKSRERDLAMVFQSYALYPHLSVAQNIAVPLTMRRLNTIERLPVLGSLLPRARRRLQDIAGEVDRVCEALSINALRNRKPAALSGGQRQRVALARAMVRTPQAFLMDEPLSNLDAKMRVQARSEIAQLHRSLQTTFVYVTHDQVEAMTMSDRIAVMMDGELLQVGSPEEIYNDPADLRVAQFIGSPRINTVESTLRDARFVETRRLTGADQTIHLAFRPEHARLTAPGAGRFEGQVRHIENLGADLFVHVDAENAQTLIVRLDPTSPRPALGERVGVTPDEKRIYLFSADLRRLPAPRRLGAAA